MSQVNDAEIDNLTGKGMTHSDAELAVYAAVWHVCPSNADGVISRRPPAI
jgi:hypothetical protein